MTDVSKPIVRKIEPIEIKINNFKFFLKFESKFFWYGTNGKIIIDAIAYLIKITKATAASELYANLVVGPINPNKTPAIKANITPNMNIL